MDRSTKVRITRTNIKNDRNQDHNDPGWAHCLAICTEHRATGSTHRDDRHISVSHLQCRRFLQWIWKQTRMALLRRSGRKQRLGDPQCSND